MKWSIPFALVLGFGLFLLCGGALPGTLAAAAGILSVLLLGRQSDLDAAERREEAKFWESRK